MSAGYPSFRARLLVALLAALSVQAAEQSAPKQSREQVERERYRLINGKGTTVCEKYLQNLNAFPATEPPMVCEQKIHPTHPEFSLPKWETMDIQSNLKIIYAAESQMPTLNGRSGVPSLPYDAWVKEFQERIRSGKTTPVLRKTVLALNSRGPETIIAYRPVDNICQSTVKTLNDTSGPDDYMFVLRPGAEPLIERINTINMDLILFRSRPYFVITGTQNSGIWAILLHYVSPKVPPEARTNAYIPLFRCEFRVNKQLTPRN